MRWYWRAALIMLASFILQPSVPLFNSPADASSLRVVFLGVWMQNDNEAMEPTTDAERNRIEATGKQFTDALAASGGYQIVPLSDDIRAELARGQPPGHCGGCEADYGRAFKADRVAWITVQKVSNLILNMNVYIVDPASGKYTFIKSVDIRGNTDQSWSRSLAYLLNNYFFERRA